MIKDEPIDEAVEISFRQDRNDKIIASVSFISL